MAHDLNKLTVLGQGAFGTVYKADVRTALKVINTGSDRRLKELALDEIHFLMNIARYF